MRFWSPEIADFLVPLKFVCSMDPEKLSESTDPSYELLYIDISSVSLEEGIKETQLLSFEEAPSRARKLVQNGDTIISTVRTYLKAIAFIENAEHNWIASTGFCVLRPNTTKVDAKYLYRAIQSKQFIDAVVACSDGVSYPAINPSVLGKIEIPVPEIEVQHTIVEHLEEELGKIDKIIRSIGGYQAAAQSSEGSFFSTLLEKRIAIISDAFESVPTKSALTSSPARLADCKGRRAV